MTDKYRASDPMSELISDDYRMLQVISRFGLAFGFGDASIQTVCRECGVDVPTFLAVVNFIRGGDHVKVSELVDDVDVNALMEYLKKSHSYFVDFRLPAIKRKLLEAIGVSSNQIAVLILKFYDEYAAGNPNLPQTWEEGLAMGIYKEGYANSCWLDACPTRSMASISSATAIRTTTAVSRRVRRN